MLNGIYEHKSGGGKAKVVGGYFSNGEAIFGVDLLDDYLCRVKKRIEVTEVEFHRNFVLSDVQENKPKRNTYEGDSNINQDIIKLIESGYEFKSFSGSTRNGLEFHVDMES